MAEFVFRRRDQAALDFINQCVEQDHAVRKEYEPTWAENWSNYRVESNQNGLQNSKQFPLATGNMNRLSMSPINFLKTPESHQGVNTLRALLLASLFGTRDYVQADPVGDEDIPKAKKVSKLVMFGLERPGNFRTNFEVLGDSLIFGLGSYSARWRQDIRLVPRRIPVPDPSMPGQFLRNPETGAVMSVLKNVEVPVFDDPVLETDDLFDTWFDSSANRWSDVKRKEKRFRIHSDDLRAMQSDPFWDADGIAHVLTMPPDARASGPDGDSHPKLETENLTQEDIKDIARFGYRGGWIYEGMVPSDVAAEINEGAPKEQQIDHRGMVILRMINGTLVQSIQSPQRYGQIQGGVITVLPTGRGLYGLSPLTIVRYLQDVSDTQLILTTQALIESVYANYIVSGDFGPNFARDFESRRPREVFTTQGEVEQLQPVPKDYAGVQIAVGALSLISQTMRQAMNARDPVQGQMKQTGDPSTATEAQLVTSASMTNTDQLAVLIERDELPVMGRLINDLYYMNLDDESKVFRRIGDEDTTDVSYFDIDCVNDINMVGARLLLNKQAKGNQFRDFAMMISSNPFTAAAMDWHTFVGRYGDEVMEVKGLEQLMIKDPMEIVARMQAAGLANTIGQPKPAPASADGGGAGPGGGSPQRKVRSFPGNGGGSGGTTPTQTAGEAS